MEWRVWGGGDGMGVWGGEDGMGRMGRGGWNGEYGEGGGGDEMGSMGMGEGGRGSVKTPPMVGPTWCRVAYIY